MTHEAPDLTHVREAIGDGLRWNGISRGVPGRARGERGVELELRGYGVVALGASRTTFHAIRQTIGALLANIGAWRRVLHAKLQQIGIDLAVNGMEHHQHGDDVRAIGASVDDHGSSLDELGIDGPDNGHELAMLDAKRARLASILLDPDAKPLEAHATPSERGPERSPEASVVSSVTRVEAHKYARRLTILSLPGANHAKVTPMQPTRRPQLMLFDARRALRMTQAEFADAVKGSHRTVVRWEADQSTPATQHYVTLAKLLHPIDRALAAEAAAHAGETLVSLKLESPPPPPAPPAAPAPPVVHAPPSPPTPTAKREDLVDILVLAGVQETRGSVEDVRRWLYAVMKRACDVGLTVQDAERALRPAAGV